MMHQVERRTLDGRACTFWIPEGEGPFPAICLCAGKEESLALSLLDAARSPAIYYHVEAEWERDFTPWPTPGLPGRDIFSGGAPEYLQFLRETVYPVLCSEFPIWDKQTHHAIAGYSLGGLFALWALFEADIFGAAASLSGSLWYDGWLDYLKTRLPSRGSRVYLSLGRSEERAGNPRMMAVGENTRRTFAYLVETLGDDNVTLEWNRGGHFTGVSNRWHKAIDWLTTAWV